MGKFAPSDIDPKLCTHIVYAYSVMDAENLVMKAGDDWLDVEKGNFKSFVQLKQQNPKLKTMIALGGWVDSQQNHDAYNLVFNNDIIRSNFIKNLKEFLKNWGFDGLDLSYQFPQINEREGFAVWAKNIRKAFGNHFEVLIIKTEIRGSLFHLVSIFSLQLQYQQIQRSCWMVMTSQNCLSIWTFSML